MAFCAFLHLFTTDLTTVGAWGVGMFLFSFPFFSSPFAPLVLFCLVLLSMAEPLIIYLQNYKV
jgi:hypothetical protein